MEHAQQIPAHSAGAPFPWRATTVIAGGVALVELVALIAIGLMHLAPTSGVASRAGNGSGRGAAVRQKDLRTQHRAVPTVPQHPLRPRAHVRVLVLNGNGVAGAAAAAAAQLRSHGYPVAGAVDANRHDYPQSIVMFVPGWTKEARRLAHDAGVGVVAPLDGLQPSELRGSKVILLLGK